MDNQNDPNSPSNINPVPPFGTPVQPPVPTAPLSSPAWLSDPAQPISTPQPANTWPASPPPSNQMPYQEQPSAWTPPAPPEPMQAQPAQEPTPIQPMGRPEPALSPLDNPWEAPTKPPPIDGSQTTIQPSWENIPNPPTENQTESPAPMPPAEPAPTDLSHLISGNNSTQESVQSAPETLVIPTGPTANPEVPTLPAENHKSIPKWLIALGAGLLILVIGASAYLILGIGQPAKTTSLPATTVSESEVKPPPIPQPVAQPTEQPAATGSANFGEVDGSAQPPPATGSSVINTLRERQQGR